MQTDQGTSIGQVGEDEHEGTLLNTRPPAVGATVDRPRVDGWLLVFVVTLGIRCGYAIYNLIAGPSAFTPEGRNLQAAVPLYLVYVLFQLGATLVESVMPVVGFVLLFGRSRRAPTFFKAYLAFMVFEGLVDMTALRVLYASIAAAVQEAGNPLAPLDAARDQEFFDGLRATAYGGIWLLYWFRSAKVQQLVLCQRGLTLFGRCRLTFGAGRTASSVTGLPMRTIV